MIGTRQVLRVLRQIIQWLWATRLRGIVSTIVAVVGTFWAISQPIAVATGGRLFDIMFPWREGNAQPKIEKVIARERGEEIEPRVPRGGAIFLNVIATDPDGDRILYDWSAREGFFRNYDRDNPPPLVLYEPPRRAGVYVVIVRVRDEAHNKVDERQIEVTVFDPPEQSLDEITHWIACVSH